MLLKEKKIFNLLNYPCANNIKMRNSHSIAHSAVNATLLATYRAFRLFFCDDTLNFLSRKNNFSLIKAQMEFMTNPSLGILQIKSDLGFNMFLPRNFPMRIYEEAYHSLYPGDKIIKIADETADKLRDGRIYPEYHTAKLYGQTFKEVETIIITGDFLRMDQGSFLGIDQPFPDFQIYLRTPSGEIKITYGDLKQGRAAFERTANGTIGIITVDASSKELIPIWKNPTSSPEIIENYQHQLRMLKHIVPPEIGSSHAVSLAIDENWTSLSLEISNKNNTIVAATEAMQKALWNIQRSPLKRSVNVILIDYFDPAPQTEEESAFIERFKARFFKEENGLDFSKPKYIQTHLKDAYSVYAELDPSIKKRLEFVHHEVGFELTQSLADLLDKK